MRINPFCCFSIISDWRQSSQSQKLLELIQRTERIEQCGWQNNFGALRKVSYQENFSSFIHINLFNSSGFTSSEHEALEISNIYLRVMQNTFQRISFHRNGFDKRTSPEDYISVGRECDLNFYNETVLGKHETVLFVSVFNDMWKKRNFFD